MRKMYTAIVTRDGKWWMIHVPELEGVTQARRLGEAGLMAREFIAVSTGARLDDVEVALHVVVPGIDALTERVGSIRQERERAAALEAEAAAEQRRIAHELVDAEVPLRDAAEVLGVSYQRVHQLVSA